MKKYSTTLVLPAAGVLFFLLGVYYLTYSGFPVADDEQLFAAVSQNLAAGKGTVAPQMYGNNRLLGNFTGSGPLHVYLGAAVLAFLPGNLGQVQALYLLTPIYTALTAALIVLIVTRMDFSLKTALGSALVFGLSTIAWPYSQTNFREPLAMLLMMIVLLGLLSAMQADEENRVAALSWLVSLVAFVGALFTKIILLSVLPAFVYLLLAQSERGTWKKMLVAGGVLFALAAAISILAPQNRFSLEFFDRLWNLRRGFPYREIPRAILEMLFAPGRGLLIYNPVLFILPLAWFQSKQKSREVWIFSILAAGGLAIAQATAYGAEWWGITWGTRFLLPILPLLVVGLAPVIDFLLHSPKRLHRVIFWSFLGLGILIQLGGVLVANSAYMLDLFYVQLVPDVGRVLWSFEHAPLLAHWRLLISGAEVNFSSARLFELSAGWTTAVIAACLLLAGVGSIFIINALRKKIPGAIRSWIVAMLIFGFIALPALILVGYKNDPRYGANRPDVVQMAAVLDSEVEPGDVILVFPYLRTSWNYFLNFYHGEVDWYSLPNTFPAGDMASTLQLVDGLNRQYSRVWLVVETGSWEPVPTFLESYLPQVANPEAVAVFDQVEENLQVRLLLYSLNKPITPNQ
ncbi:MAG: hypothetical protein ABFS17_03085 [Chloroflexota bacterium]